MTAHPGGHFGGLLVLNLLLVAGAAYLAGVQRLHARGDHWPGIRSVAAAGGLSVLGAAELPVPGGNSFPAEVVQHLMMTMLAPLLLALSAPITLAFRTAPIRLRRLLLTMVHHRFSQLLNRAPTVLVLSLGGAYCYYLTPLYGFAGRHPWMLGLIHLHMFLAGCLFACYLIRRDPLPHRPSTPVTLITLLTAAAGHDILAKLLYARQLPVTAGPAEQIHLGSQIMYYGGNIIEILLAAAVMTAWYRSGARDMRRDERRHGPATVREGRK